MSLEQKAVLQAIYAVKCEQVQIAWLNPQTRQFISDGLAFASSRKMYPYFQSNDSTADVFNEVYSIKKEFVKNVIEHIDKFFVENSEAEDLHFYNLERHFGGHHVNRGELITIIRYCSISERFDEQTFQTIMRNAPIEAKNLMRRIDEYDISITNH